MGNTLRGSPRAWLLGSLPVLDLKAVPGDGDPGLVVGRDREGVPGTDIYTLSQSGTTYVGTRRTYYVNQFVV